MYANVFQQHMYMPLQGLSSYFIAISINDITLKYKFYYKNNKSPWKVIKKVPFSFNREEASCMQEIVGSWVRIKRLTPENFVNSINLQGINVKPWLKEQHAAYKEIKTLKMHELRITEFLSGRHLI